MFALLYEVLHNASASATTKSSRFIIRVKFNCEFIHKLKALGKTVIVSSHIFSTLSDTCDEIFLQKGGEIVKKVNRKDFDVLELEMKEFTIGNKIEKLELE